jgi:predicted DNA-binding transcriptional regulator AlpA
MQTPSPSSRQKQFVLPANLPPRGLNQAEAAAYIGVGTTLFDDMVNDGRMPCPKQINRRRVWDRLKLDIAFEALPDDNSGGDAWDTLAT